MRSGSRWGATRRREECKKLSRGTSQLPGHFASLPPVSQAVQVGRALCEVRHRLRPYISPSTSNFDATFAMDSIHAQLDKYKASLEGKIVRCRSPRLTPRRPADLDECDLALFVGLLQDFVGQDLAEKRARYILWTSAVRPWSSGPLHGPRCKLTPPPSPRAGRRLPRRLLAPVAQAHLHRLRPRLPHHPRRARSRCPLFEVKLTDCTRKQVVLPPLPAYTAHPVPWLAPLNEDGEPAETASGPGASAAEDEARKNR